MADVGIAIDSVLKIEDETLSGVVTKTKDGKRTRFGIDEHYHPELTNSLFYTTMGQIAALHLAYDIYNQKYVPELCIAEIADQGIANKMLSIGVNIGVKRASRMLQSAVRVPEDGVIGVETLMALSKFQTVDVMASLRAQAERFYRDDVLDHPEYQKDLAGWITRARA